MTDTVTIRNGEATSFDGRGAVEVFRLATLASSIAFEIRCPGMRLHRGPKGSTVARRQYGLKGNKEKLLAQVEALLAAQKEKVEYVQVAS